MSEVASPVPQRRNRTTDGVPLLLAKVAGWSWRVLVICAAVALAAMVFYRLRVVTVPIFIAIFATTLLLPPAKWLQRHGVPRGLATAIVFVGTIVATVGLVYLLASPVQDQFSDLGPQITEAVDDINNWLVTGPLGLEQAQLDQYVDQVTQQVRDNASSIGTGVISSATLALEILAGFLLSIALTVYFVQDGKSLTEGVIRFFPAHRRELVRRAATRAFNTLGGYLIGVAATGLVDAFFIGIALFFLDVPLLLPLVIVTFFGAFFPVVGATTAGAVATAVALVNGGFTDALIIVGVVLLVQQIEGNVLQPLLVGRAVALHPVVIIVALTVGGLLAGILGAFLAVPIAAVVAAVWREIDADDGKIDNAPPAPAPSE